MDWQHHTDRSLDSQQDRKLRFWGIEESYSLVPGLLFEPQRRGGVNSGVSNWSFYSHSSYNECLQLFCCCCFLFFFVGKKLNELFAEVPQHVVVQTWWPTTAVDAVTDPVCEWCFQSNCNQTWLFFSSLFFKWGSGRLSSPAVSSHLFSFRKEELYSQILFLPPTGRSGRSGRVLIYSWDVFFQRSLLDISGESALKKNQTKTHKWATPTAFFYLLFFFLFFCRTLLLFLSPSRCLSDVTVDWRWASFYNKCLLSSTCLLGEIPALFFLFVFALGFSGKEGLKTTLFVSRQWPPVRHTNTQKQRAGKKKTKQQAAAGSWAAGR